MISIHALREEGDWLPIPAAWLPTYFYPRPPRGGRPFAAGKLYRIDEFLSTPSARRATLDFEFELPYPDDFYPRPPRGGRPVQLLSFQPV